MYSRNTRLSAGIGLAGHQEAVSAVRICWEIVKNRTNCSTEVLRYALCGAGDRQKHRNGRFCAFNRDFKHRKHKNALICSSSAIF